MRYFYPKSVCILMHNENALVKLPLLHRIKVRME